MARKKKELKIEEQNLEETPKIKTQKGFVFGTGRRKTAVARVFIWEEKGEFTLNDKPINDVLTTEVDQNAWLKPFHLIGVSHPKAKFKGSIKVKGSGQSSQIDAIVHGISRALAKLSEENRVILAKAGLLTRDPRMVERKKPFLHKARKRPQYSKR